MERFPENLKAARQDARMNQTELAEKAGVSRRSLFAYESGASVPRKDVLRKLAEALDVTVLYLTDDGCDDPQEGRAREDGIRTARERFGAKGAKEAAELLDRNSAFFAGGEFSQEDKDAFFDAVITAYVSAKEEARRKHALRKKPDGEA